MSETNTPTEPKAHSESPSGVVLRDAEEGDIPEIQAIYSHYVLNDLASFEIDPPDEQEMMARWRSINTNKLPFFVADVNDVVGGYAYTSHFRPRPAYINSVEDSVYVSPQFLGQGIGELLLNTLVENCAELGYRQMIAVIGNSGNSPSINLHLKCGFKNAGILKSAGYKHGGWVDSVLMQRSLGKGDSEPPSLLNYG